MNNKLLSEQELMDKVVYLLDTSGMAVDIFDLIQSQKQVAIESSKQLAAVSQKSLCGCPMCLYHTEAFALQTQRRNLNATSGRTHEENNDSL